MTRSQSMPPRVTEELSVQIRHRLAEYLADDCPDPLNLRGVVAQFAALPLVGDMGGAFAIRPDGEVISYSWDVPHELTVVVDPRLRNAALHQGSLKYPELAPLVPARSSNAIPCPHCEGVAAMQKQVTNVVCYCGGLGWLPP